MILSGATKIDGSKFGLPYALLKADGFVITKASMLALARGRSELLWAVCLVCLSSALTACKEEAADAGPGIWVIVDAEPGLRQRLDRVELQTSRASKVAWLTDPPTGEQLASLPLLIDLPAEGRATETLRVRGYDGDQQLVERVAVLSFVPGQRLSLRVMLSDACAAVVATCDADQGLTCVDCAGRCDSSSVAAAELEPASSTADPRAGYAPMQCSPLEDAGSDASDGMDADMVDLDASDDGGSDAALDASDDAGRDAAIDMTPDAAPDAMPDSGPADPLFEGCSLLLHMDEASWSGETGEVRDDSGFENHGNAVGSATTTAMGRFGRAAQLDGAGWVHVDDAPSLRPAGELTVSAWFYLDELSPTRFPGIVAKRVGYMSDTSFAVFVTGDTSRIAIDVDYELDRFESNTVVEAGRWYHVAFVFDGSLPMEERVALYVDGALDRTGPETSTTIPAYTSPIKIGNLINGADTLIGRVDNVALWTRALSASEIGDVFASDLEHDP